jgi:vanillate/3-O-methylgallate O-demethylase
VEAGRRSLAAGEHPARIRGLAAGAGCLARRGVNLGRVAPHVRHGHRGPGRHPAAGRGEREQLREVRGGPGQAVRPGDWRGHIVTDGILRCDGEQRYTLSGIPAAQNWVKYHGETGGYDVTFTTDPSSAFRGGGDPELFRYQVQGPLAADLVETTFGAPLPPAKFFHSVPVTLNGMHFRALRHNMAGQDGYEFIGPWQYAARVKNILMQTGAPLGLVHVGQYAYASASVESGWIPSPVPGIYTDPDLAAYRAWLPLYGIEGQRPLNGSFFSPDIEDYYCSPYELGYGRSISFNHDFIGRTALEKARDNIRRAKVTLVFNPSDVRTVLGADAGFYLTYARHRVEAASGALAGLTYQTATLGTVGTILSLTLIDKRYAEPGTEVTVVWGEHPGPGTDPDADLGFPRIRAIVQPAPFDQHARTLYRRNA